MTSAGSPLVACVAGQHWQAVNIPCAPQQAGWPMQAFTCNAGSNRAAIHTGSRFRNSVRCIYLVLITVRGASTLPYLQTVVSSSALPGPLSANVLWVWPFRPMALQAIRVSSLCMRMTYHTVWGWAAYSPKVQGPSPCRQEGLAPGNQTSHPLAPCL